ncbi:MAG: ABC transporter ATP-binding protein [Myxococcota bacterium]
MPEASVAGDAVLSARALRVAFPHRTGPFYAVDGVSFDLVRGKTLALVGESGCGKTITALALLSLVDPPGRIVGGSIRYRDQEIVGASPAELCRLRGRHVAMIFQEPMTALNPVMRIGDQVAEPLRIHERLSTSEAKQRVVRLLGDVGIPASAERYDAYPHELSGGMRQRVVIAIALACSPDVIIADEPTTALDVTIQAQILDLMRQLQRERHMAVLFITHDLALVETVADDVAVMYAGRIVEQGSVADLTSAPRHPYSRALWCANPASCPPGSPLQTIGGSVPGLHELPDGCAFQNRCPRRQDRCVEERPELTDGVACFDPHAEPLPPRSTEPT